MDELTVGQEDVAALARTLEGLDLPQAQRALLSAIIAIATDAIHRQESGVVVRMAHLPSIEEQFATAFAAGPRDQGTVGRETTASISVRQTYTAGGGIGRSGIGRKTPSVSGADTERVPDEGDRG